MYLSLILVLPDYFRLFLCICDNVISLLTLLNYLWSIVNCNTQLHKEYFQQWPIMPNYNECISVMPSKKLTMKQVISTCPKQNFTLKWIQIHFIYLIAFRLTALPKRLVTVHIGMSSKSRNTVRAALIRAAKVVRAFEKKPGFNPPEAKTEA